MTPERLPPRAAESFVRAVHGDGVVGRSIVGDLAEEFDRRVARDGVAAARWWYRRQAIGLVARGLRSRVRDGGGWADRPRSAEPMEGRGDPMMTRWWTELSRAVRSLDGIEPGLLAIQSQEVMDALRVDGPGWSDAVPPLVARLIRERGLFGYPAPG